MSFFLMDRKILATPPAGICENVLEMNLEMNLNDLNGSEWKRWNLTPEQKKWFFLMDRKILATPGISIQRSTGEVHF